MRKLKNIQEDIHSITRKGDILFIVPPFVNARTPILGPHILQSVARQQGYKAEILYMNLLLASIIGNDVYESISYGQPFRMMGERLFARSAHELPPLGKNPELSMNPSVSVFGNKRPYSMEEFEYKYIERSDFNLDRFFEIEEICESMTVEICQAIVDIEYKIIGCSTNWEQNNCCVALINRIKKLDPDILALIGGSNCEAEMAGGIASLSDSIDYIFSGESELTFSVFLKKYSEGNLPSQRIIDAHPVEDLDNIPMPDYRAYFEQADRFFAGNPPKEIAIGYETSRGCWWGKCDFCGQNGRRTRFRKKSENTVASELKEISARHPHRRILIIDKVMPPSYQNELLPLLRNNLENSPVSCEHRANLTLEELIRLKEANFNIVKFGIEALSTGLLKLMKKGVTASENILLLRNAQSLGIYIDWNMLWGFPNDQLNYYKETLELIPLIHHLTPPAVFRHLSLDRFCNYFEHPEEYRIENLRPWNVYKSIYPDWADVDKVAYRFMADYPCEAHDNPEIIREIGKETALWKKSWEKSKLLMVAFGNSYLIYDSRNSTPNVSHPFFNESQAREIMTPGVYNGSDFQKWAVENKMGVIVDARYAPLVTASAELLTEFAVGGNEDVGQADNSDGRISGETV